MEVVGTGAAVRLGAGMAEGGTVVAAREEATVAVALEAAGAGKAETAAAVLRAVMVVPLGGRVGATAAVVAGVGWAEH